MQITPISFRLFWPLIDLNGHKAVAEKSNQEAKNHLNFNHSLLVRILRSL
jgi:hypothetical protein